MQDPKNISSHDIEYARAHEIPAPIVHLCDAPTWSIATSVCQLWRWGGFAQLVTGNISRGKTAVSASASEKIQDRFGIVLLLLITTVSSRYPHRMSRGLC